MKKEKPFSLCPRCGWPFLETFRCGSGPHYAKLVCGDCRLFRAWVPEPVMTAARARAYRMPFGVFRDVPLGSLLTTSDGQDYLRWLSRQTWLRGGLRRAVQRVLEDS